ncbi:predicted protein [Uncinocarpus reesii 1704]|uniref:SAP domain-containing protein n=1 Tax=Uncinocarpus reesii (strain UAMH 1704) TaxID=336963 RepID=C4JN98_UNCRE|nr:uncharacterized protein UREG_04304 [Uncinocarpus reesii 1704]EEP79458.1 predicted protein [Uncinocarpus reesii 1704]
MADYSGWKVAELKAELKRRGIPQTGLRLKQQIIDRLLQHDSSEQNGAPAEKVAPEEVPLEEAETSAPTSPKEAAKPEESIPEQIQPVNDLTSGAADQPPAHKAFKPSEAPPQDVTMPDAAPLTDQPNPDEPVDSGSATGGPATVKVSDGEPNIEEKQAELREDKNEAEAVQPSQAASTPPLAEKEVAKEEIDDSKKRKRRSQSPPPSPRSVALKRARAEDGQPRVVLQEDLSSINNERGIEESATAPSVAPQPMEIDVSKSQAEFPARDEKEVAQAEAAQLGQKVEQEPQKPIASKIPDEEIEDREQGKGEEERPASPSPQQEEVRNHTEDQIEDVPSTRKPAGDARFKDLFSSANNVSGRRESPPPAEDEERVVAPALHPATTSLYIRDFMRPLQVANLKKHLASLAAPPNSTPDPDAILDFFLDAIRTHCFVTFTSVAAASRVRTALHDTIWPEERSRKPLWADFVPEEKVKEWADLERAREGGRDGPRWEVVYEEREDGIEAVLQEAVASSTRNNRNQSFNLGREPPTGPRAERGFGRGGPQAGPSALIPDSGFKALDDRFQSTSAKPKLYFLPVPKEISEKRLDKFDDLAARGPTRRPGGDEMRRYTFEDEDYFVDQGPEYGARRGRGPRGRGGGAFTEWGGSWRGGR